jgi:hypothetical protein
MSAGIDNNNNDDILFHEPVETSQLFTKKKLRLVTASGYTQDDNGNFVCIIPQEKQRLIKIYKTLATLISAVCRDCEKGLAGAAHLESLKYYFGRGSLVTEAIELFVCEYWDLLDRRNKKLI